MAIKITDRIVSVTRRGFLSSAAGAIAASGAALLPNGEVQAEISEMEQMAHALHRAVGRYSDTNAPTQVRAYSPLTGHSLMFAMDCLRDCSVDEIQDLLKPLYQGGAS